MFQTRLECTRFTPPKVQGSVLGYSLNELDWKCGAGGIKLSGLFFLFKSFLFRELSCRNLWDPTGCIFLLTKLGGQFHGRFAVSTPYFLSFPVCLGFFPKEQGFFIFYFTYSLSQCLQQSGPCSTLQRNWCTTVIFLGGIWTRSFKCGLGLASSSPAMSGCRGDAAHALQGNCSSVAGVCFHFYESLIRFSD